MLLENVFALPDLKVRLAIASFAQTIATALDGTRSSLFFSLSPHAHTYTCYGRLLKNTIYLIIRCIYPSPSSSAFF
jgi:hypothetical protein